MKTGNKIGDTIIVAIISPNISVYVFISVYKTFGHINFPVLLAVKIWKFGISVCDLSLGCTHSLTPLYRLVGLDSLTLL